MNLEQLLTLNLLRKSEIHEPKIETYSGDGFKKELLCPPVPYIYQYFSGNRISVATSWLSYWRTSINFTFGMLLLIHCMSIYSCIMVETFGSQQISYSSFLYLNILRRTFLSKGFNIFCFVNAFVSLPQYNIGLMITSQIYCHSHFIRSGIRLVDIATVNLLLAIHSKKLFPVLPSNNMNQPLKIICTMI